MKPWIFSHALFALFLVIIMMIPVGTAANVTVPPGTTPFITIDPIGNYTVGEVFFINGTTNLDPLNESLIVQIMTSNINPGGYGYSVRSRVSFQQGEQGVSNWSCKIQPDDWVFFPHTDGNIDHHVIPGKYLVDVTTSSPPIFASAADSFFVISPENKIPLNQTPDTSGNSTRGVESPGSLPRATTIPSASSPAGPVIALGISIVAAAGLLKKKDH